jgi:hypothetical protein
MKTQAKSALVVCEYCKKEVRKRGLVSHIRLKHKIRISNPESQITGKLDYGKALKELDKIDRKIKKLRKQFILYQKNDIAEPNIFLPDDIPEIRRDIKSVDQKIESEVLNEPLYTTEDVQILMGKIFVEQKRFSYLNDMDPFLEKELKTRIKTIISDFEKRFKCKYKDLQKEFPDYQPTKNPKKWKLRYIQLSWFSKDKYSK